MKIKDNYDVIVVGGGPAGSMAAWEAAKENISAVIQPGGSINDKLSINCCDENNMSMVFTKTRHFKH